MEDLRDEGYFVPFKDSRFDDKRAYLIAQKLRNTEQRFESTINSLCEAAGLDEPESPTMGFGKLLDWIKNKKDN